MQHDTGPNCTIIYFHSTKMPFFFSQGPTGETANEADDNRSKEDAGLN